jgi:tetratricopeptide (TPR) repeat protein
MPTPSQPTAEPVPARARRLQAAAILFAGWFAFSPALHGAWLWDDTLEVARNPNLRDLAGLERIWRGTMNLDYLPVKSTVDWLGWQLWGAHVFGYHALNLGLHLASALLLWQLLRRLGVQRAWLGGLLFAVHPLGVESVAWIAELKNTLSLPFLLLAMIAYVDYDGTREGAAAGGDRRRAYAQSLGWFVLSLLSKSSAMMFPVILLLYAWWRRGRVTAADARASAPFFALSLARGLVTVAFQLHWRSPGAAMAQGGPLSRLAAAGLALAFYLAKAVWPAGLLPVYPRWSVDPAAWWQFLPWVLAVAVFAGLWARRETWSRTLLFGLGCCAVNLLPVLGFVPLAYPQDSWVADHLAYLPLAAAAGLAAAGLDAWFAAAGRGRAALPAACVLLVAGSWAAMSRHYSAQFVNEETLWTYTVRHDPASAAARKNLGTALLRSGQLPGAIASYAAAARLAPRDAVIQYDLGNALLQAGRPAEAVACYRHALGLQPEYPEAHDNLGIALQAGGQIPEAIAQFEIALRERPGTPDIHYNLGNVLLRAHRSAEAVTQYQAMLRLEPNNAQAHYNLGLAFLQSERYPEAIAEYGATLRLMPGSAEAHNNLGNALLQVGQVTDAIIQYEEALRLDPHLAGARRDLQVALHRAAPHP